MKKQILLALLSAAVSTIGCGEKNHVIKRKLPVDQLVDELAVYDDAGGLTTHGMVTLRVSRQPLTLIPSRTLQISKGKITELNSIGLQGGDDDAGYCNISTSTASKNVVTVRAKATLVFVPAQDFRQESSLSADGYKFVANYMGREILMQCYKSDDVRDNDDYMTIGDLRGILGSRLPIWRMGLPRGDGKMNIYGDDENTKPESVKSTTGAVESRVPNS